MKPGRTRNKTAIKAIAGTICSKLINYFFLTNLFHTNSYKI